MSDSVTRYVVTKQHGERIPGEMYVRPVDAMEARERLKHRYSHIAIETRNSVLPAFSATAEATAND